MFYYIENNVIIQFKIESKLIVMSDQIPNKDVYRAKIVSLINTKLGKPSIVENLEEAWSQALYSVMAPYWNCINENTNMNLSIPESATFITLYHMNTETYMTRLSVSIGKLTIKSI